MRRRAESGGDRRGASRSAAATGVAIASLVLAGCSSVGLGGKAPKYPSHPVSVFHLRPGECLNPPGKVQAQVSELKVLSCDAPHTQQVYALLKAPGSDNYPGAQVLQKFANAKCLQHFAGFVGVAYQHSTLFYTYLLPSVRSWAAGDRTVTCLVTTTGAKLTSSVKGSKR